MKKNMSRYEFIVPMFLTLIFAIILNGCSALKIRSNSSGGVNLSSYIKPGEPIAIMPFETESALSNLGGLVSDEITTNLLENVSSIKIIPTTVTRNFLQTMSSPVSGIPDYHTIHTLSKGLKCRYLLTGNFYSSVGDVRYSNSYTTRIASGSVTVRLIDCDSATVIWAKHIQDSYQTTSYYTANSSQPAIYYTDGQLMQELIKKLGSDVAQYFYRAE
jgi:TolB-like protein